MGLNHVMNAQRGAMEEDGYTAGFFPVAPPVSRRASTAEGDDFAGIEVFNERDIVVARPVMASLREEVPRSRALGA